MKNKFYAVVTKCGHVGNGKYREVTFPINADSGKEAAEIARWIPRVKHHKKGLVRGAKINKTIFPLLYLLIVLTEFPSIFFRRYSGIFTE